MFFTLHCSNLFIAIGKLLSIFSHVNSNRRLSCGKRFKFLKWNLDHRWRPNRAILFRLNSSSYVTHNRCDVITSQRRWTHARRKRCVRRSIICVTCYVTTLAVKENASLIRCNSSPYVTRLPWSGAPFLNRTIWAIIFISWARELINVIIFKLRMRT